MNTKYETEVAIIGSGPVGLFAAFQCGMLGMKCHIIETLDFKGGQCAALYPDKPIYDIPAHPKITALELVDKLYQQASVFNPVIHLGQQAISFTKEKDFFVINTDKIELKSKIILIAAGSGAFGPNKPPLENLNLYENQSVFYSVKDSMIFKNKNVVIAGGGDSALDWASMLSTIAKKVYLVHRRKNFRGLEATIQKIHELTTQSRLELIVPYQLDSLNGNNGYLTNVNVRDMDGNIKSLKADYLLPFFGLKMDLGPLKKWGLELVNNHIEVDSHHYQTNIEGIYAVGDIAAYTGKVKLILTGFAEVASALHHAYKKVKNKELHFQYSTTQGIPN